MIAQLDGLQLNDDMNDDAVELPSIGAISGGHTRDSGYEGGEKTSKTNEYGGSHRLTTFQKPNRLKRNSFSSLSGLGDQRDQKAFS